MQPRASGGASGAGGMTYRGFPLVPNKSVAPDPLDSDEGEDVSEPPAPPEFTTPLNAKAQVIICVSTGNPQCKSHTAVQSTNEYVLRNFARIYVAQNKARLNADEGLLHMRLANPIAQDISRDGIDFAEISSDGMCKVDVPLFVVFRPCRLITDLWEMVHPLKDNYKCVYIPGYRTQFQLHSGDIVMMFRKPAGRSADDMIEACAYVCYCIDRELPPLDHLMFLIHSQQAVNSAKAFLGCYRFRLNYPYSTAENDLIMSNYHAYRGSIPPPVITPQKPMPLYP